jgi:hypothetical protein
VQQAQRLRASFRKRSTGLPGDGAVSHSIDEATGFQVVRESRTVTDAAPPVIAGPTLQTEMRIVNSNKSFFMGCGGWDKK